MRQLHGHSPMALSPTTKALKCTSEPSGELRGARHGQTVVGIDLSRSSCSMSYRMYNAGRVQCVEFNTCYTTPIVLLLSKLDGHYCKVDSIGTSAMLSTKTKCSLTDLELSNFHYFELNMLLYRYKVCVCYRLICNPRSVLKPSGPI